MATTFTFTEEQIVWLIDAVYGALEHVTPTPDENSVGEVVLAKLASAYPYAVYYDDENAYRGVAEGKTTRLLYPTEAEAIAAIKAGES